MAQQRSEIDRLNSSLANLRQERDRVIMVSMMCVCISHFVFFGKSGKRVKERRKMIYEQGT